MKFPGSSFFQDGNFWAKDFWLFLTADEGSMTVYGDVFHDLRTNGHDLIVVPSFRFLKRKRKC